MSIVPNTAATERIFSKMGAVHTKRRSRLRAERVRKAVVVKDHLDRKLWRQPKHIVQAVSLPPNTLEDDEDDEDDEEAEDSVVEGGSSFTAVVNDAIDAADRDDSSAFSTTLHIPPSGSRRSTQILHCDGLSLHHIFDYTSPAFRRISDEVWESGQKALKAELSYHDAQASSSSSRAPS